MAKCDACAQQGSCGVCRQKNHEACYCVFTYFVEVATPSDSFDCKLSTQLADAFIAKFPLPLA